VKPADGTIVKGKMSKFYFFKQIEGGTNPNALLRSKYIVSNGD